MAITRVNGSSISGSGTTASAYNVTGSPALLAGDLLVITMDCNGTHAANGMSATLAGETFTTIAETQQGGASARWVQTFYCVLATSQTPTPSVTPYALNTASTAVMDVYRGANGLISRAAQVTSGASGTSATNPALLSAPLAGDLVLTLTGVSSGTATQPAAFTLGSQSSAGGPTVSSAYVLSADGASTYGGTWTWGTANTSALQTVAFGAADRVTVRQQIDNGVSGTAAMSLTLSSALVGDTVTVIHADNFHTAAEMTTPTGTAVGGGWTLQHTLDGGASDSHAKVWTGTVTTAGGTVVEGTANTDHERYLGAWVLAGTALFDTAASTDSDAAGTSHIAPTVTPTTGKITDLLICLFATSLLNTNYTIPGTMTARTERDTGFATYRGADEQLSSDVATGTRTATSSVNDTWIAVSVVLKSGTVTVAGPPVLNARPGQTWQRRFKHPQILPTAPAGATTNNFTQPLNATLSFTSSQNTATSKGISAALSFTSSLTKRIVTNLATATLSFTGTVTKRTAKAISATLSFTGSHATAVVHNFTQALNATLSFTGSQTRSVGKALSATVSFTSSQTKQVGKLISATVSFTSNQSRAIRTNLAGTLSFTGSLTKRTAKILGTATLSFTGSVTTLAVHVFTQAFNATLSFTSSQTRRTNKAINATVSFTSSQTRSVSKLLSATVSFTSSQSRRIFTNLAATLSFTSAQTRRTAKNLGTATLSFTGSLATLAVHVFTQAFNATLSFTGSLATHRTIVKAFSATLSFTSSQTKRTAKVLAAGLSFTGSQTKRIAKTISAALGLTGLLDRLSSAQPTSGTASAAQMSVPDSSPGSMTAPGSSAADGAVPAALRGSGTAPTSEAGNASGPTSSAP